MADEIVLRGDEPLERRFDRGEVDISDKAIDAGVDAGRLRPVQIVAPCNKIRQHRQVGKAARVDGSRSETADALIIVALAIEFLCLAQALLGQARMLSAQRLAEGRPNRSSFQRE